MTQIRIETDDLDDLANGLPALIGDLRLIRVDGHSGAGKSFLSRRLAPKLGIPYIELDELMNFDNRTAYGHPEARARAVDAVKQASFRAVVDGIRLNSLLHLDEFGPEFRIFVTKPYGARLSKDEERRREKIGTSAYLLSHEPEKAADLVIVNTWRFF